MSFVWEEQIEELHAFEKVKLEKDGLDILKSLADYQKSGFNSISANDRDLLKWAGVYVQKPRTDGYLMMRVKIPSGILNSQQARVLARIARNFGRGIVDITTRQAIQFHWLTVENLPKVFEELHEIGLDTTEACGDCPRTILGNPLAGIDPDETMDTTEIVEEVFEYFQNNREFSNLPRKFKISISANVYNTGYAEINDLALTPAVKTIEGQEIYGFHVYVGGGLSAKPHLAQKLDLFVQPHEVLKVSKAVVTIFRDFGYRKNRQHARLKFLVADWGEEKFKCELLKLTGPLESSGTDLTRGWNAGSFYGVHPQKQPGLSFVGLSIPVGRLEAEELEEVAQCAERYGDGSLRTTNSKNLLLANIANEDLDALQAEDIIQRFAPKPQSFAEHVVTCTGKEFCNLALVETKNTALRIAEYLDQTIKMETPLRIHINGCPNACGQAPIADIGLRGAVGKVNGEMIEKFQVSIGGKLGENARFAVPLQGTVPANQVHEVVRNFDELFQNQKLPQESFSNFVDRIGVEIFQDEIDQANMELAGKQVDRREGDTL
jgi:ferredoxin-nitrite reductase